MKTHKGNEFRKTKQYAATEEIANLWIYDHTNEYGYGYGFTVTDTK